MGLTQELSKIGIKRTLLSWVVEANVGVDKSWKDSASITVIYISLSLEPKNINSEKHFFLRKKMLLKLDSRWSFFDRSIRTKVFRKYDVDRKRLWLFEEFCKTIWNHFGWVRKNVLILKKLNIEWLQFLFLVVSIAHLTDKNLPILYNLLIG